MTKERAKDAVPQAGDMFSPASFYDVLSSTPEQSLKTPLEPVEPLGRSSVVAFYGFRGGAGRTLALAHVAVLLGQGGAKVVAVDLDLEAPGLDIALGVTVPEQAAGVASLLRAAVSIPAGGSLRAVDSLLPATVADSPGRVLVLPAGRVNRRYLAEIEELGVPFWHAHTRPSPLQRVLEELRSQVDPDVLILDCRTGFNGLSASVLFHIADLAVVFVPLSEQVWDGLRVVLEAAHAAKRLRAGRPAILLVPSLVPPGDASRALLSDFIVRLAKLYADCVGPLPTDPDSEDPDEPVQPWLTDGVRYDAAVASVGRVTSALQATSWGLYQPLTEAVARYVGLSGHISAPAEAVDAQAVLNEIQIDRELAFGETPDFARLARNFVAPADLEAALDRSTTLVVGAKGAGKTWLWRYLVNGGGGSYRLPEGIRFLVGHGPSISDAGELQISASGFHELEGGAGMQKRATHGAFWRLYAAARLTAWRSDLADVVVAAGQGKERKVLQELVKAQDSRALLHALTALLRLESVGTLAEAITAALDRALLKTNDTVTLVYDGLDTGFEIAGSPSQRSLARRERFVTALVQVMAEARSQHKRLFYKIFLREDIYISIEIQNKSHLDAAKFELRWRPIDLWRIALNIAATSRTYSAALRGFQSPWPGDEDTLKGLLAPFWGETIEKGKKAKTANYIQKRTSDAGDRLFPRTLVQVLDEAVRHERSQPDAAGGASGRVIRFVSLRKGIARASAQRVEDLTKEYAELGPYLKALKRMEVTGTRQEFIQHLQKGWRGQAGGRRSLASALHAGSGGWQKVIDRLMLVGVLGPYRRGISDAGEPRLAVALLYRLGLEVKQAGLA